MKTSERSSGVSGLSDEAIIELYWNRNEQAISETEKKYGRYLYTIAYNIVHDRLDCEECVNDTYLGVWNRIPPTRPNIFCVFLSKVMRNIAIDRFRKNRAAKQIPSEMLVSLDELDECMLCNSPSAEEDYEVREVACILNRFLRELDERREFEFVCRYYYSDGIRHIAQMLQVSENTVYRDLAEIRKSLKEQLKTEGYYHEET